MASNLHVSEVPAGLEVGLPPSGAAYNPSVRKPVPSYRVPTSIQDGTSKYYVSEEGPIMAPADRLSKSRQNPCGLNTLMFGLLVALVTLVVVGGVLGGGLGASLAAAQSKNASSFTSSTVTISSPSTTTSSTPTSTSSTPTSTSPSTTTITATTTTTSTTTTTGAVDFDNYSVPRPTAISDTVALDCPALNQQYYTTAHSQTFLMSCNVGLTYHDLLGIVAYIVDDCIEACSFMNAMNGTDICTAITFNSAIYDNWDQHANCWLKFRVDTTDSGPGLLSASLVI